MYGRLLTGFVFVFFLSFPFLSIQSSMMKSLVIFFGCILGLGVANAATTNVTYEPRLAMSANARARTRQLVADMKNRTARGHIRELMASLTSPMYVFIILIIFLIYLGIRNPILFLPQASSTHFVMHPAIPVIP